ncbi:MAG: pyocin knob domain-containing protein [Enterovibrio sp.]
MSDDLTKEVKETLAPITPIPDNEPYAKPSLWNTRYREIDAHLGFVYSPYNPPAVENVTGLQSSLDSKYDKTGGVVTGRIKVFGDTSANGNPYRAGLEVYGSVDGNNISHGMNFLNDASIGYTTNIYTCDTRSITFSSIVSSGAPTKMSDFAVRARIHGKTGEMYLVDGTKRVFHEGYIPSAANVGALPLSGGNITGKISFGSIAGTSTGNPFLYGFEVYGSPSTSTSYGMNLLAPNSGSSWGLNLYVANQPDRNFYFTKINSSGAPARMADFTVKAKIDATTGEMYLVDGTKLVFHAGNIIGKSIAYSKALTTENLNDLKTPNVYHQSANASASTALNYPELSAGSLVVYQAAGVIQEYRVYNSSRVYTRANYNSTSWSAWSKTYNTANKPTSSELGAVNKAGDTMSSTLSIKAGSASFQGLSVENTASGWSYIQIKAVSALAHIAVNNGAVDGGTAGALHLRPRGNKNGSLVIQENAALKHQTSFGYILIGALNADWCHFNTDRAKFHFAKPVHVQGEIYAGSNYSQRVYHEGYKPTPATIGAYTQSECNSKFIAGIRLGSATSIKFWGGPGFSDRAGYVITSVINSNSDDLVDVGYARPIQYLLNGTWYTCSSV